MAEMTIQLKCDPVTGKKDIIVSLRSDEDSLPHEHEQRHRELVDQLIEGGVLTAAEVGKVIVEREEPESESSGLAKDESEGQRSKEAEGQSG